MLNTGIRSVAMFQNESFVHAQELKRVCGWDLEMCLG